MSITPAPQAELRQQMTLEEWLEKVTTLKNATRELVRLWFVNGFGSQRELAGHLGMSTGTISGHMKSLRASQEVTEEHYPFFAYNSRTKRAETARSVENDVIDAEVTVVPDNENVVARSIKERTRKTPKHNLSSTNNVRRHQPERSDQHADGGRSGDDPYWNINAEHYQHVQDSDEPDSYKEAQYHLTQFSILLKGGSRAGWSQEAFNSIRTDLDSWARTCAACSDNYRERIDERAEKEWSSIERAILGSESGSSSPGIEGSELN